MGDRDAPAAPGYRPPLFLDAAGWMLIGARRAAGWRVIRRSASSSAVTSSAPHDVDDDAAGTWRIVRRNAQLDASFRLQEFMMSPTVPGAVRLLKELVDADPYGGWAVFQRVLTSSRRLAPCVPFFQAMMSFCHRCIPGKGPHVFEAARSRDVPGWETLFGSFVTLCLGTSPPMVDEAWAAYRSSGIRTHDAIYSMAHISRVGQRPRAARRLVQDALDGKVAFTEKLVSTFAACCIDDAEVAERLLDVTLRSRINNQPLVANLVKALVAGGRFGRAIHAMQQVEAGGAPPSEHAYNLVVGAYTRAGRLASAIDLVQRMLDRAVPVCLPVLCALIVACRHDAPAVRRLHDVVVVRRPLLDEDVVVCAFISAFGHCGDVASAENVFRSWTGRPSITVFNAIIGAYNRNNALLKAIETFDAVRRAGLHVGPPIHASMLAVFAKANRIPQALALLRSSARDAVDRDPSLFAMLVAACARCSDLAAVHELHRYARASPPAPPVEAALIAAYAACGQLHDALNVFQSGKWPPTLATLNAVIDAYADHGVLSSAMGLFARMKRARLRPDRSTLLSLLKACSNSRDLEAAVAIVAEFAGAWRVRLASDHVRHLVDLYGRTGDLDTAERLCRTSVHALSALRACRRHRDVPRGARVFARLQQPADDVAHALLSDLYASVGCATKRATTSQGPTTLMLPGSALRFATNDRRLQTDGNLRQQHRSMLADLRDRGYQPDVSGVDGDVLDDALQASCVHSEKIALAYALRVLPPGAPVFASKPDGICPDCHDVLKRVSALYRRDVGVRDRNAYHRFRDGRCSCDDYWCI